MTFEERMRELEYFHGLRLLPGTWCVIRVDGRGFSKFTEKNYEKPFDRKLHDHMITTSSLLFEELQADYAYTESDEISLLFRPDWALFSRSLEKIVSVSAGIASSAFTKASSLMAHFDSRVWLSPNKEAVVDYFRWRQSDGTRCCLNQWCYWLLRKDGLSADEATVRLEGQGEAAKNELLYSKGINFNEVPLWQRRGTAFYWESYEKSGFNPIKKETVVVTRRRIHSNEELPMKDEYSEFLRALLNSIPLTT